MGNIFIYPGAFPGGAQGAWAPPLGIEKQKKKGFQILAPPPLRIPGHAPDIHNLITTAFGGLSNCLDTSIFTIQYRLNKFGTTSNV